MHYVIIGNSVAAAGAIEGIRQVDQEGSITIFSDEPHHIYSRPLISYFLADKVGAQQMKYRPDNYYEANKVTARLGEKVIGVNGSKKVVVLEDGQELSYDKLLVATGGKPIKPPIKGLDKGNVHTFLQWDEVKAIKEKVAPGKKVVVLGAGLIGLKAAEGLKGAGCEVTVIDLADRVLSAILDHQAGELVQQHLQKQQIKFYLNNTVEQVLGDNKVAGVRLKDGTELACDLLIVAIGVIPSTEILKINPEGSRVKINRGIIVNQQMATSVEDIYAAGDVAEGLELLSASNRVLPILPNAYRQGEVAGINMAGGQKDFGGGIAMNAIGFFGLQMVTAGYPIPLEGEGWEVIANVDLDLKTIKKVMLKQNRVMGFIFLNMVDKAGIYSWLLENQIDVTPFKEHLLKEEFGFAYLPEELRKQRLVEGGRD
ncbi:MAG: FAD-dependent oxidoreductase [Bacillota bacterium]|nr:FAD-dependent oxidoreductase [Bacillota bacterium]